MALDRPDDDFEAGDARLEQHLRSTAEPGGDDARGRGPEPAEPRTREEYYEALRAADDRAVGRRPITLMPHSAPHVADSRTDHSGWDTVDATNRPPVDAHPRQPRTNARTYSTATRTVAAATGTASASPARPSFRQLGRQEDHEQRPRRSPASRLPACSPGLERPMGLHRHAGQRRSLSDRAAQRRSLDSLA